MSFCLSRELKANRDLLPAVLGGGEGYTLCYKIAVVTGIHRAVVIQVFRFAVLSQEESDLKIIISQVLPAEVEAQLAVAGGGLSSPLLPGGNPRRTISLPDIS